MAKKAILDYLNARKGRIDALIDLWRAFKERETYLTFRDKDQFLESISEFKKIKGIPWYSRLYLSLFKRGLIDNSPLVELQHEVRDFNQRFIPRRLSECESFFRGEDDGLKYPLDSDQQLAVVHDDIHNLVIAGAGSGKTSVLTTRIAYLVRRQDAVDPGRILALAFTNVAATEMKARLKENYGIDVDISTFHSLGLSILKDELGKRPRLLFDGNEREKRALVKRLFEEVMSDKEYQRLLIEYLAYHAEQEVEETSFQDKETYLRYMENKRYSTLNDIEVKSISERNIGNFFFLHGIPFQYEAIVDWVDESEEDKDYRPDFYLPEYDVYIEHWGLNREMKVPSWFTKSSEEYLELRTWKLEQFQKHGKTLIETWEYERLEETLEGGLEAKLKETIPLIEFKPLGYAELVKKVDEFRQGRGEMSNLVLNFISNAKSNFLKPIDIASRVDSGKYSTKQQLFGKIALAVYERYEAYLENEGVIDFDDMINRAVEITRRHPEKYGGMYDHVLVDEFQDISYQRMQLITSFVNERSNTKLFCVGDDWQSIYQFTGSDVSFFVNFENHFPRPEISFLKRNYRSTKSIVDMSNDVIANNTFQKKKEARATGGKGQPPVYFELASHYAGHIKKRVEHYYSLIKMLIDDGVEPAEIMVLSRFNNDLKEVEVYCGANGIPTEHKHGGVKFWSAHKSKGSESTHVIIIDVTSGLYGFPCEVQDSSVLEMAKRMETKGYMEEERRLFYVALTRSKQFLYVFSIENSESPFIGEIADHVVKIHVDTKERWLSHVSRYMGAFINGKQIERPIFCPECGKALLERDGRYGRFLGCSGYPGCKYTFDPGRHSDADDYTRGTGAAKRCIQCNNAIKQSNYLSFNGLCLDCWLGRKTHPAKQSTARPGPGRRYKIAKRRCNRCGGLISWDLYNSGRKTPLHVDRDGRQIGNGYCPRNK